MKKEKYLIHIHDIMGDINKLLLYKYEDNLQDHLD